jgi:hypothetical protein
MKIHVALTSLMLLLSAAPALSLPEAVRYGQFSCVTCHVSPGGGGMMTPYGREFSAEKLSTWSYENEGEALHGLVPSMETFLVGGDARWVKMKTKNSETSFEKFWRMQTDVEAGLHVGPVWLTGMWGTKPAGPMDEPKDHGRLVHRGYSARVDLLDERVLLRAGLFMPRFGLMSADHTLFVRSVPGLTPDSEQTQAEVIIQEDNFEVSLATLMVNKMYDREYKTKSGYNLGVSAFVAGKNRLSLSVLTTKRVSGNTDLIMNAYGTSGVLSLSRAIYAMFEMDRVDYITKSTTSKSGASALVNYLSLNAEVMKGLIPYLRYEFCDSNISAPDTSTGRWGAGFNWYPRPHAQIELRFLKTVANANQSMTNETDAVLHYYF